MAVGIGAWAIKSGPPTHASIPKLNRLIWIEEDLARMGHAGGGCRHACGAGSSYFFHLA